MAARSAALPEVPEHAYIVTPTEPRSTPLEECGKRGLRSRRFSRRIQRGGRRGPRARARAARHRGAHRASAWSGRRSLGVVNMRDGCCSPRTPPSPSPTCRPGAIFAASHSGTMIGALLSRGKARGIGFAGFVSVGNEVDLSHRRDLRGDSRRSGDHRLSAVSRDDPQGATSCELRAGGGRARQAVIAYKLGRSAAARSSPCRTPARSPAKTTSRTPFSRLRHRAGRHARGTDRRTAAGGPVAVLRAPESSTASRRGDHHWRRRRDGRRPARRARRRGRRRRVAAKRSRVSLAAGIDASPARLVDLTLAARVTRHERGARHSARGAGIRPGRRGRRIFRALSSGSRGAAGRSTAPGHKPLAASWCPTRRKRWRSSAAAGVPSFRTPEACADAIAAALVARPPRPLPQVRTGPVGGGRLLDELEAGALLDRLGIARAPRSRSSPTRRAHPHSFAYPVVVKVLSAEFAQERCRRRSAGVRNGSELIEAFREIRKSASADGRDRVLVQPMVTGIGEALLGYRVDGDVGPLIMVAAGGCTRRSTATAPCGSRRSISPRHAR